jgi:hypothetical protein
MNLKNLSIKRKMMPITMLTSSAALVLFSASFLVYDLISFRHFLSGDLATQAEIIGYNSAAAMAFKDEAAATVTLTSLQAKEDITAACSMAPTATPSPATFAATWPNRRCPRTCRKAEAFVSRGVIWKCSIRCP